MANFLDTPDTTSYYSKSDIKKNTFFAALSYIWILVLVPIFAAKDSPYAKFHANQGLNLLILNVFWEIVAWIIGMILGPIAVVGVLWGIIAWIVRIALILLMLIGILNAAQGRARELPFIGGFRILK